MYETLGRRAWKIKDVVIGDMRISEENIDLFETYLGHSMTEKEVLDFEARLVYDNEFSEEFEAYKQLETGVQQHFRNELKSKFSEIDEELDKQPLQQNNWRKVIVWSSSIAAIFLIGIFIYRSSNPNYNQLAQEYWPYEAGLPVKMSNKGKYDDAMNAFKQENWNEAENLLKQIKSDTADYFLGVISYEKKDYQQAINYFRRIEHNSSYYQEAQFRLSLTTILSGNIKTGKQLLQAQIEQNTNFKEQANILLQKLN